MKRKLRVGLIGTGYLAHKALGQALHNCSGVRLVAVADRDQLKAAKFRRRFGGQVRPDGQAIINDPNIDCVYISLPSALHHEWILKAAAAGKHVICDKPATLDLTAATEVIEVCRQARVRFLEAFSWCWHPQHQVVGSLLTQGRLGQAQQVEAVFGFPPLAEDNFRYQPALGGGAFYDLAGYGVGLARLLFGANPIRSFGAVFQPANRLVDTRGVALLLFSGGRSAQFTFGFDYSYRNSYTVWGSQGRLTVEPAFTIPPTTAPRIRFIDSSGEQLIPVVAADQFVLMIDAFAQAIDQGDGAQRVFEEDYQRQAQALAQLRQAIIVQTN